MMIQNNQVQSNLRDCSVGFVDVRNSSLLTTLCLKVVSSKMMSNISHLIVQYAYDGITEKLSKVHIC